MLDNRKTLIFEGAGWSGAEASIKSGVGNCRIRTRIRNKEGRLIYLELSGSVKTKHHNVIEKYKDLTVIGYINSCFYYDDSWDKNRGRSKQFRQLSNLTFEYNKQNILDIVNKYLNCDFEDMIVINDFSISVFNTESPLSDCSKPNYKPYQELQYNIELLSDVQPTIDYPHLRLNRYQVNFESVEHLIIPSIPSYILSRYTKKEIENMKRKPCYIELYYDNNNIITECVITSRFGTIGMYKEDMGDIINIIKHHKNVDQLAI